MSTSHERFMSNSCRPFLFALIFILCLAPPLVTSAMGQGKQSWFLDQINVPTNCTFSAKKKIVVAIVDDGIRTSHNDLRDFIWQNPYEIAGNFIDDDGNGAVDDSNGWDVADNDNSVTPPPGRIMEFYHGTHLAGIVAKIARAAFGKNAADAIVIMPVKSLPDDAPNMAIRHGYQGIEYAVRAGADIILCAWSVGHISLDEEKILHNARQKGVLIIASAGNFPEEREQYPAADNSVLAVAALGRDNHLSKHTNYGTFVDLSAPGEGIDSASSAADAAFAPQTGTSQAAAMVAGAAAIMLTQSPGSSPDRITACLKNGSTLLEPGSTEYSAKQGAGLLNIDAAVACLVAGADPAMKRLHPQGYLDLSGAKPGTTTWTIEPAGMFKGIWLSRPEMKGEAVPGTIDFFSGDSGSGTPLASFSLAAMPDRFFVPGTKAAITIRTDTTMQNASDLLMEYRAEAIKLRSLYCRDTAYLTEQGSFSDGSGGNTYSANSDCKWLITAPEGKVIHFTFTKFDTEPLADPIYFFNGSGTHEPIMAIFSGPNIPPELTTWERQVLVWFVTNGENQGQGWKGEFTFLDKAQAHYPSLPKSQQ